MRKFSLHVIVAVAALGLSPVHAQDDGLEGLEMDVMEADESPREAATQILTLPDAASDAGRDNSGLGLQTANEAREGHRGGRPEGTPGGPPEEMPGASEGVPGGAPEGTPDGPPEGTPGGPGGG